MPSRGLLQQACSRPEGRNDSISTFEFFPLNSDCSQAQFSEPMVNQDGSRISGKKRKRNRQRNSHNRFSDRTHSFKSPLPNRRVDVSEDGFLSEHPFAGSSLFLDGGEHQKKMRQTDRQRSALISDASAEREEESLRAWVEMGLRPQTDYSIRQGEQDGLTLARSNVVVGRAFTLHDNPDVRKRCGHHEDMPCEHGINGIGDNSYRNERVLHYVAKRCVLVSDPSTSTPVSYRARTIRTDVTAWGKGISVTVTTQATTVQGWISRHSVSLYGLDVEWRPNRARGVDNKVALLQLCTENECLIVQLLFLDYIPEALRELLFNPLKRLAGVGVHADAKRLLKDYGLVCQGEVELTTLAAEVLKREELKHTSLKALVQQVLGLNMKKSKSITLSDWSRLNLSPAQVEYACIDAWVSFALAQKLTGDRLEAI